MLGLFQNPQFLQNMGSLLNNAPSTTPQPMNWQAIIGMLSPQQQQQQQSPPAQTPFNYLPAAPALMQQSNAQQTQPQPQTPFLNSMKGLQQAAIATYPDNPILQQVALAQAVLESGPPGNMSKLASQGNNLFGIKASQSAPGTANNLSMPTTEYVNGVPMTSNLPFSQNNSIADSFMQHRNLLTKLNRYQPVINAASPEEAFTALQKGGYATDPNYANKLNRVYNTWVKPLYAA